MSKIKKTTKEAVKEKAEQAVAQKADQPKKIINAKLVVGMIIVIIIGGSLCFAGYFYWQYRKILTNPNSETQSEIKNLTAKIGKFVDLPIDEDPTMAEVKNSDKLKGQLFFSGAQNGDKVLIYSKNKKAVLYRPGSGKVIEVTSLGLKSEDVSAPAQETPVSAENVAQVPSTEKSIETQTETITPTIEKPIQSARVVVYNGSSVKGLAKKMADEISTGVLNVEIVKTGNSAGNYSKTIVVDLGGNNTELVQKIIAIVGGKAGELPDEEEKPEGDILVIGGQD